MCAVCKSTFWMVLLSCIAQSQNFQIMPTRDLRALKILSLAVKAAGGEAPIAAIHDYSATGTITYSRNRDSSGSVRVLGSTSGQLRLDTTLPMGEQSVAMNQGEIMLRGEDGGAIHGQGQAPMNPARLVLPYLQLRPALSSPIYQLAYLGAVKAGNRFAHHVQLQRSLPGSHYSTGRVAEYQTISFFIDAITFQVLTMEDFLPKHLVRRVHYADYRWSNGLLVPFTIAEEVGGQPTWSIQLNGIAFNSNLQEGDFTF